MQFHPRINLTTTAPQNGQSSGRVGTSTDDPVWFYYVSFHSFLTLLQQSANLDAALCGNRRLLRLKHRGHDIDDAGPGDARIDKLFYLVGDFLRGTIQIALF